MRSAAVTLIIARAYLEAAPPGERTAGLGDSNDLESFAEILDEAFEQCCRMDASLNERLQAFAIPFASSIRLSPGVDQLVARLHETGAGMAAPGPGDLMPSFLLPDDTGHLVSLEELLQKGPIALAFHRGHWCPYCRINTNALVDAQSKAKAEGGQIAAILPERRQFASELRAEAQVPFPILLDMDNGYAMSLNLAIWVGEEMKLMMAEVPAEPSRLPGQRCLDAADTRHLRRCQRRAHDGALRRPRLPQTDGDGGHARRAQGRRLARGASAPGAAIASFYRYLSEPAFPLRTPIRQVAFRSPREPRARMFERIRRCLHAPPRRFRPSFCRS